jgi:serine/threonine protein kinase
VEGEYILKMADFGLACFVDSANQVDNIAGTPMYMAPEIIAKQWYNHQCDIWSIGVMLYLLLCQYDKEAEQNLREMIQVKQIEYPPKFWEKIDPRGLYFD